MPNGRLQACRQLQGNGNLNAVGRLTTYEGQNQIAMQSGPGIVQYLESMAIGLPTPTAGQWQLTGIVGLQRPQTECNRQHYREVNQHFKLKI